MTINTYTLLAILGCGVVTLLSRTIPFALVKNLTIPRPIIKFLSFVPVAIMAALFFQSVFNFKEGQWATINWPILSASVPAIIAAIISKSLMVIVVVGIISMALLRYFGM